MREKRGAVLTKRQRISRYHGRERGLLFAYDGIQNSLNPEKEASSMTPTLHPGSVGGMLADVKQPVISPGSSVRDVSQAVTKCPVANAADQSL